MIDEAPSASPTAEAAAVGATDVTAETTVVSPSPSEAKVETTVAAGDKPASEDAKKADPSTAKAGAKEAPRKALLDVMKDVGKKIDAKKGKSPVPELKGEKPAEVEAKAEGEKTPAEKAKAEEEDTRFDKHPRFQRLLRENQAFKEGHDQHEQVLGFMAKNNLAAPEVQEGFQVMALIKNNPGQARVALQTWLDRLDTMLGNKLPKDLQDKVEAGAIDEPSAKELSLARVRAEGATRSAEVANGNANALAMQTHGNDCVRAVNGAENVQKGRDPDYAVKAPFVHDILKARISENKGLPKTTAEAVTWFNDALKIVTDRMSGLARNRVATKPTASAVGKVAEAVKPKTMREAIMVAGDKYKARKNAA